MINRNFWQGRRVFLTGHTGFKGSWLCLWLTKMGAHVSGYSLEPPTNPNLFSMASVGDLVKSIIADVRDGETLAAKIKEENPEIVMHLAAQPIVRDSYKNPVNTYAINVMGTVNLLNAVRESKSIKAVVNITTDKCYENKEWAWGYRENEPMGGYDPYSNSKACSELVTAAFRDSFFNVKAYNQHGVAVATARAGNVIGGGDWAADRLVPDCVKSLLANQEILVRNPLAIRPWQHVLEPLSGYLVLAEKLYNDGPKYAEGWNLGPDDSSAMPVQWVVESLCSKWGGMASFKVDKGPHPHEANYLKLDCSKAKTELGWKPKWDVDRALDAIVDWYRAMQNGKDMREICLRQIESYDNAPPNK